jgi:hypothetical protein
LKQKLSKQELGEWKKEKTVYFWEGLRETEISSKPYETTYFEISPPSIDEYFAQ